MWLTGSRPQAQQLWRTGLVAPRHVGSSRTRARTRVPCIGRWILDHCATREARPSDAFKRYLLKISFHILVILHWKCSSKYLVCHPARNKSPITVSSKKQAVLSPRRVQLHLLKYFSLTATSILLCRSGHLFIHQISAERLLCARYCFGCWDTVQNYTLALSKECV